MAPDDSLPQEHLQEPRGPHDDDALKSSMSLAGSGGGAGGGGTD